MGARGHIGIVQSASPTPIYFYTHWEGGHIVPLLAEGLHRATEAGRLSDDSYATRIIFDTLTGCTGSTTSFGIIIGEPAGDNEYPIPTVFWESVSSDPYIVYEDRRYSAQDFIAEFLVKEQIQMPANSTGEI
jgi:hypothetical protein